MDLTRYSWRASRWVVEKLKSKGIDLIEVEEAVKNSTLPYLEEKRSQHVTNPPTRWFISLTDEDRLLKVVFIVHKKRKVVDIKSAFEPTDREIEEYEQY